MRDPRDTWEWWDQLRSLCLSSPRIGVGKTILVLLDSFQFLSKPRNLSISPMCYLFATLVRAFHLLSLLRVCADLIQLWSLLLTFPARDKSHAGLVSPSRLSSFPRGTPSLCAQTHSQHFPDQQEGLPSAVFGPPSCPQTPASGMPQPRPQPARFALSPANPVPQLSSLHCPRPTPPSPNHPKPKPTHPPPPTRLCSLVVLMAAQAAIGRQRSCALSPGHARLPQVRPLASIQTSYYYATLIIFQFSCSLFPL
jgi:hypothetical protein